jgi:hypothetical protein
MDMKSRNQYLKELRKEYLKVSKKEKGDLLDEAVKRTGLHRKHLMVKLSPKYRFKDKSDLPARRNRPREYDNQVIAVLVKLWQIFDRPCGQRLEPLLKTELDRLVALGEINCSGEVRKKLKKITSSTIDKRLARQKEYELLKEKVAKKELGLYQEIPTKTPEEWNRSLLGQLQIDHVEHCGTNAGGEYIFSLSVADICTGWWEGQPTMGAGQERTFKALCDIKERMPFVWKEIHPDNGSSFINWHLYRWTKKENIIFTRSRPYQKNDNNIVEQKNSTHIRKQIGYRRYDTKRELEIIKDLYQNELRLFKNYFQPTIKLVAKTRIKGKLKRKYDKPKTPYQRVLDSGQVDKETKQKLTQAYHKLNPAKLKRNIDVKLKELRKECLVKKNKKESEKAS